MQLLDRFAANIKLSDGCWEWIGTKRNKGYGSFYIHGTFYVQAHRFCYELLSGPIPAGLTLDHLCRNTSCVNPDHLEPVTNRENTLRGFNPCAMNARKTRCKNGHEFTQENIFRNYRGGRGCVTCNRTYQREWARQKAEKFLEENLKP